MMIKTRKTYGVSGLVDWTANLKVGRVTLRVQFSGGGLTAYGVTPAKFTTDNTFFQRVIETSKEFLNGRIELLSEMEVEGEQEQAHEDLVPAIAEATTANQVQEPAQKETPTREEQVNVFEVADRAEAIEILKERFPEKEYTATKLRTATAFETACKECGISFTFTAQ